MEAANLPVFLKFGNTKKSEICVIFAKSHGGHETGGPGAKLGACASLSSPSLKPSLPRRLLIMPM